MSLTHRLPPDGRAWRRGACALVVAILSVRAFRAAEPPPEGIAAGPWVLAPALFTGFSLDTNPFYRNDAALASNPDHVTRVSRLAPRLRAVLPFRNSEFDFSYEGSRRTYSQDSASSQWGHEIDSDLVLRLGTGDQVVIHGDRTSGSAETRLFDGGEVVYDGSRYRYANLGASLERSVYGRPGWLVELRRSTLDFDPTQVLFFEFRGYEGSGSWRQPLSPTTWALAEYEGRRFDHILATDPSGKPFRNESTDVMRVGVQGMLGDARQYYRFRLGKASSRFPGAPGPDYHGWVGDAVVNLAPGPSSSLVASAGRRLWPSFYGDNNYYVATSAGLRFEVERRRQVFGGSADWVLATYELAIPGNSIRRDRSLRLEAYATLQIRRSFGVRVGVSHARRRSSVDATAYDGTAVTIGTLLGWP